jgi:anti-sigma factor RsiW
MDSIPIFINLNNYEQWLIMYVDDELSAEEKLAVERFALTHQHVQQELELFRQAKLQAEEIVFLIKKYYTEEKNQCGLLAFNGGRWQWRQY